MDSIRCFTVVVLKLFLADFHTNLNLISKQLMLFLLCENELRNENSFCWFCSLRFWIPLGRPSKKKM